MARSLYILSALASLNFMPVPAIQFFILASRFVLGLIPTSFSAWYSPAKSAKFAAHCTLPNLGHRPRHGVRFRKLVTEVRYAAQLDISIAQCNLLSSSALAAGDKGQPRSGSRSIADLLESIDRQRCSMPISMALSTSMYVPRHRQE